MGPMHRLVFLFASYFLISVECLRGCVSIQSVYSAFQLSSMVNLETFDTDFPAGFTVENAIKSSSGFSSEEETSPVRSFAWVVDNAIKSDSEEETFAVRSFASVVDSAINSDGAEDVEEDFWLFTNNFSLQYRLGETMFV